MNKETTFVYDNHPMFNLLLNSCSNPIDADSDYLQFDLELHCTDYFILARRIYSDLEKTYLAGYEIIDFGVRPL